MGVIPQTTKNGLIANGQFNFDKQQRGNSQAQLGDLALKDSNAVTGAGKNANSNLTQLVSPSGTFGRTGSRQGNSYNRAISNGQIPQSSQNA